jgi:hypothetical protein
LPIVLAKAVVIAVVGTALGAFLGWCAPRLLFIGGDPWTAAFLLGPLQWVGAVFGAFFGFGVSFSSYRRGDVRPPRVKEREPNPAADPQGSSSAVQRGD